MSKKKKKYKGGRIGTVVKGKYWVRVKILCGLCEAQKNQSLKYCRLRREYRERYCMKCPYYVAGNNLRNECNKFNTNCEYCLWKTRIVTNLLTFTMWVDRCYPTWSFMSVWEYIKGGEKSGQKLEIYSQRKRPNKARIN